MGISVSEVDVHRVHGVGLSMLTCSLPAVQAHSQSREGGCFLCCVHSAASWLDAARALDELITTRDMLADHPPPQDANNTLTAPPPPAQPPSPPLLTSCRASLAAACTLGCGSPSTPPRRGTMVGRQEPSCLGAQWAMAPSSWMLPCLVRQALSSRPFSSAGSTSFTPDADSWPMMERAASSAAARTWGGGWRVGCEWGSNGKQSVGYCCWVNHRPGSDDGKLADSAAVCVHTEYVLNACRATALLPREIQ
jgi:hypothetical protein